MLAILNSNGVRQRHAMFEGVLPEPSPAPIETNQGRYLIGFTANNAAQLMLLNSELEIYKSVSLSLGVSVELAGVAKKPNGEILALFRANPSNGHGDLDLVLVETDEELSTFSSRIMGTS